MELKRVANVCDLLQDYLLVLRDRGEGGGYGGVEGDGDGWIV